MGAALGVAVGAGAYPTPTFKRTCTWNATGNAQKGAKYVALMVQGADAYLAGKRTGSMKANSIKSVTGIGNDAYYLTAGGNVGLNVKKGNAAFKVAVYGDLPIEKKTGDGKDIGPAGRFQALTSGSDDRDQGRLILDDSTGQRAH